MEAPLEHLKPEYADLWRDACRVLVANEETYVEGKEMAALASLESAEDAEK